MRRRRCSVCGSARHDARAHRRGAASFAGSGSAGTGARRRNPDRRRNVDGFTDEYGRFRPIRHSPAYDDMAAGDVIGRRGTPGYRGRMSYVKAQREHHHSLPAHRSPPGEGPYSLRARIGRIAAASRARTARKAGKPTSVWSRPVSGQRQHHAYAALTRRNPKRRTQTRPGYPPRRAR